jgi:hypothetical protein
MPRQKKQADPVYKLTVSAAVNGRVHKADVHAFDESGNVRFSDHVDLREQKERVKLAEKIADKLKLKNSAKTLEDIETQWWKSEQEKLKRDQESKESEASTPFAQPKPEGPTHPYVIEKGRICLQRFNKIGFLESTEVLCNFTARIVEEATHDDGSGELRHVFKVGGVLDDGTLLPETEVLAGEFASMNWALQAWGTRAIVCAGVGAKDHLRAAIQKISAKEVNRRTVFAHTGWRSLNGQWAFLHAGGAIGPNGPIEGTETQLPGSLDRAILPVPPEGDERTRAVRASLELLDLGPERITAPLLGATYRAVLGEIDCSVYLVGSSGSFKTEMAALCQQHYGTGFGARNLPGNWSSTANATEGLAFAAKNMLMVIDDFAPGGSQTDVARLHREADRIFRGVGNHAGRQRMRSDGTLRPERPPRCLILSTGEDVPRGYSVRGRVGIIEVSKGDVASEDLSRCQQDATDGWYAQAMSAYLSWIAGCYEEIHAAIREEARELRDQYHAENQHARTPGIRAELTLGWQYFLRFAVEIGAITKQESADYQERADVGMKVMAENQAAHQQDAEPVEQFLSLLRSVIASGKAHVASPTGDKPADRPDAWGWRKEDSNYGPVWKPQGDRIGWVEQEDLYLDPGAAHAAAQGLASKQGESLPIMPKTMSIRLNEKKKLKSVDAKRKRLTIRCTLENKRLDVWHLSAAEVSPGENNVPNVPNSPDEMQI